MIDAKADSATHKALQAQILREVSGIKQTTADMRNALDWAIEAADGRLHPDAPQSVVEERADLIERWRAIREDLTEQELAQ